MISRVADSCFWITRYLERVDTLARLLGVYAAFDLDAESDAHERWHSLVVVAGAEADFLSRVGSDKIDDGEAVQEFLTWDPDQPSSILASLGWARENARTIREVISLETWEVTNELWLWLRGRDAKRLYDRDRDAFYDHLSKQCMLFHGICYSTMLHEDPFLFMKLGRAVERIGQTARVLDAKHHSLGDTPRDRETADDAAEWLAILRSCSAFEPFFKHAANVLSGPTVARFLLFEESFPRSVVHNVERTRGLLARLRADDPAELERPAWQVLEGFRTALLGLDIEDVQRRGIHETLTWIVGETAGLCNAIHEDFLDPSDATLRARARVAAARGSEAAGASQSQRQG